MAINKKHKTSKKNLKKAHGGLYFEEISGAKLKNLQQTLQKSGIDCEIADVD